MKHFGPLFGTTLLLALTVLGCDRPKGTSSGERPYPTRVGGQGEGDATATSKVGVLGEGGGKRLVVDMQRPALPGEATINTCWTLPADDFSFGRAVCSSDSSKSVELTSTYVNFVCGSGTDFQPKDATATLDLTGCPAFEIFSYKFDPPFFLKVVE